MDKKVVITGVICLILGGAAVMVFKGWDSSDKENIDELKAQLEVLQRRDKQSAVLQSVSKQMEEIAYEQKKISDEQREEAEEQTKVANEMRQRSEEERHNAIIAQQKAIGAFTWCFSTHTVQSRQSGNRRSAELCVLSLYGKVSW